MAALEMASVGVGTGTRAPLGTLNALTAVTLVGGALSLVYAQAGLVHEFNPGLTVFATLEVIAAALIVLLRWRWLPLLGTLFGTLVIVGNNGPIIYDLAHPASFHPFTFMVIAVAVVIVAGVAGVAATVQNYRRAAWERRTPRGLAAMLIGVAMLCVGAITVAAIPQQAGAAVSSEILAELPAITTSSFHFDMPDLKVRAGETVALRLDNTHGVPHSFDIDDLNVHVSMPVNGSSLALFKPTAPGTYTYYCQIPGHREAGMQGTLVVEP